GLDGGRIAALDHGQRGAEAAEEIADLAAVAVDFLVGTGEEGVVVPHDLLDPFGIQRFDILQAAAEVVAVLFVADEVFEEDEIERPLAVPEILLRRLDERTEEAFPEDDEAAEKTAVAAEGEPMVPSPQPLPVGEIAGGLDEKVVEGWRAPRRGLLPFRVVVHHRGAGRGYSARTTATVTSATTSGCSSTRTE